MRNCLSCTQATLSCETEVTSRSKSGTSPISTCKRWLAQARTMPPRFVTRPTGLASSRSTPARGASSLHPNSRFLRVPRWIGLWQSNWNSGILQQQTRQRGLGRTSLAIHCLMTSSFHPDRSCGAGGAPSLKASILSMYTST